MWNAACPAAPCVRRLLLAFAVALGPLTACPGWGAERPATAPSAAPAAVVPTPGAASPSTGAAVPAGSPTTTLPSSGESPGPGGGPGTGGDKATAPPPRPLERLVFDCDSASTLHTTCAAIAAGSDAGCKTIKDSKLRTRCVTDTSYFIAAKRAPEDNSWRFPDSWMQWCGKDKDDPAASCEALRDAVRSGEASRCPGEPASLNAACRAMAATDPSLCGDDKDCSAIVSRSAVVARGGLKALAAGATNPADKSYARAALGEADACKELAATMKSPCATARSASASATTPPSTQPAPQAPQKDKKP